MCIDLVESNETDAAAAKTTTRKPSFKGCPLHMPHTKKMWRSAGHSVVPQQLNKQPGTRDGCSPVCTNHARLRFRLGSSFRPHRGGARNHWLTSGEFFCECTVTFEDGWPAGLSVTAVKLFELATRSADTCNRSSTLTLSLHCLLSGRNLNIIYTKTY